MPNRPLFWLGLLLGSLVAFRTLLRRLAGSAISDSAFSDSAMSAASFFDLTEDAIVACDRAGTPALLNTAAAALFGASGVGLTQLCYPSGQAVPEGQHPLRRAKQTGGTIRCTGYLLKAQDGSFHVLDIQAMPIPSGGAAAVIRDVTKTHASQAREAERARQQLALHLLCREIGEAQGAEVIGRAAAECARSLARSLPNLRVWLYFYDPSAQELRCLVSDPEDQPKRPRAAAQPAPPTYPFDARNPALWQIYIDRLPSADGLAILGADPAVSCYALPLLAGGRAVGHLALTSSAAGAFYDAAWLEALAQAASLAAQALTVPLAMQAAARREAESAAIREMIESLSRGLEHGHWVDQLTSHVKRVVGAEVCTLSLLTGGMLTVAGEAYGDDLLFPGRLAPSAQALIGREAQAAQRTQKPVCRTGIVNPSYETGLWRAFAGNAGRHSVTAVPLPGRLGVLTVFVNGSDPLPDAQLKFLETAAALAGMPLSKAALPENTAGS